MTLQTTLNPNESGRPETKLEPITATLDSIFDLPAAGETQKLLKRIAWLNAESVRTSEEKLALATTAYDLVSN